MREQVLWRKISRIVLLLSARLEISPERALNLFYETNVCAMLHDSRYGLHLMSDKDSKRNGMKRRDFVCLVS